MDAEQRTSEKSIGLARTPGAILAEEVAVRLFDLDALCCSGSKTATRQRAAARCGARCCQWCDSKLWEAHRDNGIKGQVMLNKL
jgi:hypothetical protein